MKNANMPAMPVSGEVKFLVDPFNPKAGTELYHGLTKREHFAAMAMQGLCANHTNHHTAECFAVDAVAIADALLAELEK